MTQLLDRATRRWIFAPCVALGGCVGLGAARALLAALPAAASSPEVSVGLSYAGIALGALASTGCLGGRVAQGLTLALLGLSCCGAGMLPAFLAYQVYYLIVPASLLGGGALLYRHLRLEDRWGCVRLGCGMLLVVAVLFTGMVFVLLRALAIGGGVLMIINGIRCVSGSDPEVKITDTSFSVATEHPCAGV